MCAHFKTQELGVKVTIRLVDDWYVVPDSLPAGSWMSAPEAGFDPSEPAWRDDPEVRAMAGPSHESDAASSSSLFLRQTEVLVAGVKATVPLSRSDALVAGFVVLDADGTAKLPSPNDVAPADRSDDAVADWLRNLSRDSWTRQDTSQAKSARQFSRPRASSTVDLLPMGGRAATFAAAPAPPALTREGVGSSSLAPVRSENEANSYQEARPQEVAQQVPPQSPTSQLSAVSLLAHVPSLPPVSTHKEAVQATPSQPSVSPVPVVPAPAPPRLSTLIDLAEAERNASTSLQRSLMESAGPKPIHSPLVPIPRPLVVTETSPPVVESAAVVKAVDTPASTFPPSIFRLMSSTGAPSLFKQPKQPTTPLAPPLPSQVAATVFGRPSVGPETPGLFAPTQAPAALLSVSSFPRLPSVPTPASQPPAPALLPAPALPTATALPTASVLPTAPVVQVTVHAPAITAIPAPPLRDEQPEVLLPIGLPSDPAPAVILSPSARQASTSNFVGPTSSPERNTARDFDGVGMVDSKIDSGNRVTNLVGIGVPSTAEVVNRIAAAPPPPIQPGTRSVVIPQSAIPDANGEALYVGWRAEVGETASNSFRLSQQTYDAVTAPQRAALNPVVHAASMPSWAQPLPAISSDAPEVIRAVGLKRDFRNNAKIVSALSDVSLSIASGEFVVITGPSGSGKTTLLNCLAGFDNVDAGQIVIDGYDVALLSDGERTRHRSSAMGFVFQSYNLLGVLSAAENVEVPLLLNGWSPSEARDEALAALTLVGMANRADHLPDDLSGGEQQRVTIARALVGEPRLLWADEPTGNLDPESTESIMHLLRELNADGLTIVMVTHDRSIASLAHRCLELREGQLVGTKVSEAAPGGSPDGLSSGGQLGHEVARP